jgi:hypothetical protein
MDVEGFLRELPALFADFPRSEVPLDRSLRPVCEAIDGLSEDDAEWPRVRAATDAFVAGNPEATLRLRIAGRADEQSWWWDGVDVVEWSRRGGATPHAS